MQFDFNISTKNLASDARVYGKRTKTKKVYPEFSFGFSLYNTKKYCWFNLKNEVTQLP